jgi:hypothetical protein
MKGRTAPSEKPERVRRIVEKFACLTEKAGKREAIRQLIP